MRIILALVLLALALAAGLHPMFHGVAVDGGTILAFVFLIAAVLVIRHKPAQ